MNRAAVFHVPEYNYAYPVGPDTLCVRLLAMRGDLEKVRLYYRNLYEHVAPMHCAGMALLLRDGEHDVFEACIRVPEKRFRYFFHLQGDESVYYTSDGFLSEVAEGNCFFYPYINPESVVSPPAWAAGQMVYQVLIDRFFDGDTGNNPPGCAPASRPPGRNTYYGGDFEGLIQKLPYIASLGAGLLYLSPVFRSPSYHKYDTEDYYEVEAIYGGAEKLKELVRRAHEQGIGVLLDGVFNHSSSRHPFFLDLAEKGEQSAYRGWYCAAGLPVDTRRMNYESFGGLVPEMPRWNTSNPAVAAYLTDVALHWTRELDLDGWRMDVADEISEDFWRYFRKRLKAEKPDILLIGEIWNHAGRWTAGDELDTFTNYKFRGAMLALAEGRLNAEGFWQAVAANRRLYKSPLYPYMVNLLGSHDTERLATRLPSAPAAALALLTMLCFEGMPLLYYGDELGLPGGEDPDNRRAMPWGLGRRELLQAVQALGALRRENAALRLGGTRPAEVGKSAMLLCFTREHPSGNVRVAANFETFSLRLPARGRPLYLYRATCGEDAVILHQGGLAVWEADDG